ncbi:MAG TPA: hypothetical protein P5110_02900, partial [Candidatus Omnitrophota bacterium]|nr:hypothetical protein [Candidatus Omnitrophota bacterium]
MFIELEPRRGTVYDCNLKPLAVNLVDPEIIQRGILPPGDLYPQFDPDIPFEERKYAPPLGEKLRMLF